MKYINVGVVGFGNMGSVHAWQIYEGKIPGLKLACVCDSSQTALNKARHMFGDSVEYFSNYKAMIDSGKIEAIIIATPHMFHPVISIDSLSAGLHVLTEKPVGVDASDIKKLNDEAVKSSKTFAIMFNQRTNPLYRRLKQLVDDGVLGEIKRFVWIINNWYRTQYYYDSGDWRGTWTKEGGGVLINQCPHNLDIWQWIMGMPSKVEAYCHEGHFHRILVEDDATIYAEYDNGALATFITSTGEFPGTNRLEISGTLGKAVIENEKLTTYILDEDERKTCFECKESMPLANNIVINEYEEKESEDGHIVILKNFANHILYGEELIAPGIEGINELLISNAAYLSAWQNRAVPIPFSGALFTKELKKKQAAESHFYREREKRAVASENETEYSKRWSVRW